MFANQLREGIREGRITCSVRIWRRPHVKVGGRYAMGDGHVIIESIRQISLGDISGELARRSGFKGVVDLLKVAKHGSGTNVYLIEFHYVGSWAQPEGAPLELAGAHPYRRRAPPARDMIFRGRAFRSGSSSAW